MTLRTGLLMGLAVAGASFSSAQTFTQYLQSRKQFGITQAASPAALESFVGQRVVEVRGLIRGFLEVDGRQLLVLENPDTKRELYVTATDAPSWLKNTNTLARLIIKADRKTDSSPIEASLITAIADYPVTEHENKQRKAQEEKARKEAEAKAKAEAQRTARNTRSSNSTTSRGGPARMPGDIPPVQGVVQKGTPQLSAETLAVLPEYSAFIRKQNKRLSQTQADHIAQTILLYAVHYGVDPRLIMALVLTESGFDPAARSHAGAQGLGQLMPGTARGLGVSNSYDTEQNIYGTVKLLRGNIDKYSKQTGDDFEGLILALAAYNAGPGAVRRHGGVPPYRETQNYVKKVIATYRRLIGEE